MNNQFVIEFAKDEDIGNWMSLVQLVKDDFPGLIVEDYIKLLKKYINEKSALIIKDKSIAIGVMAFSYERKNIEFLAVHPQYRQKGIAKAFLEKVIKELLKNSNISVTTYRENDDCGRGVRELYKKLGFADAELLIEYGYPTQRLIRNREEKKLKQGEN